MNIRLKLTALVSALLLALAVAPAGAALAQDVSLQAGKASTDTANAASETGQAARSEQATEAESEAHADGWEHDGKAWRYWKNNEMVRSQWVVTDTAPGIKGAQAGEHRYWIAKNGKLARKRLIDPSTARDKKAGYYAYATKYGYVAVGKKSVGTKVYLAKENGELETGDTFGILDSAEYGDGTMQRYIIDKKAHAAITGKVVKVSGWGSAYAYPKKGYIARGLTTFDSTHLLLATDEGKLYQKAGWVVTGIFAGKAQRYYLEPTSANKNVYGARTGLFYVKGWGYAYGYPSVGFITRGVQKFDSTHLLLADHYGHLYQKAGWVDTKTYAGTTQRYYVEPTARDKGILGARTGVFSVKGWGSAYAYRSTGYIARGKQKLDSKHIMLTDSEGRLNQKTGWVTTDAYGDGEQRYYFEPSTKHSYLYGARTGMFSVGGLTYSANSKGVVFRNGSKIIDSTYYNADGNGALWRDDVITRMYREAQDYWSPSQYLLMVDTDDTKTIVFEGSQGNWDIKFIWDCSTGAPETPTVLGTFQVGLKGYSFGEDHGYSCYYWTQFYGDYLFHTRIYWANTHDLRDVSMNTRVSQGCVRLYDEDAKWIWDNVPSGTTVVTLE